MTSTAASRTQPKPTGDVAVTMYDVGFGDCFLLSFGYNDNRDRQVLIDCGSLKPAAGQMAAVVKQIKEDSGGHVDGLVVTHRHLDHLSAFGTAATGKVLEQLQPDVVVQPWTEHPGVKDGDEVAPSVFAKPALAAARPRMAAQALVTQLAARYAASDHKRRSEELPAFLVDLNIHNAKAVARLARMGKRHAYVHFGSKSGLEDVLPGIGITVLGPPTRKQCPTVTTESQVNPSEFWKLRARLHSTGGADEVRAQLHPFLFPRAATTAVADCASYVRWAVQRLDRADLDGACQLLQEIDDWTNNTSVILLFEVKDKALLFPGDAQWENWQYALSRPEVRKRLEKVTLYKVGHHGSANATPLSLWNVFGNRDAQSKRRRMTCLLSTKDGAYQRVPRRSLVNALKGETTLHSTENWTETLRETYSL